MEFNPVYLKDLRLNVKSMKYAMLISIYNLCLGLILLLSMYVSMHKINNQIIFNYENCEQLYFIICGIELGSIFLIVPALTVGTIAGEREKQTLDLLLVSKLRPFHIVCGKMAYVFTNIFVLIVSGFPITSLVVVTGSLSLKLQWQLFILLLVTSLYVTSIGLFFSTVKISMIAAVLHTYGVIMFITLGTILIYNLNVYFLEDMRLSNLHEMKGLYYMFLMNPLATYVYVFASPARIGGYNLIPYRIQDNWIELSIFFQLSASILLVCASARRLERDRSGKRSFGDKKRKTL